MSERLPRTFMDRVNYQLVLRAYEKEWTASYEWGQTNVYGERMGYGPTMEDAIEDLRTLIEWDLVFKNIRRLLPK